MNMYNNEVQLASLKISQPLMLLNLCCSKIQEVVKALGLWKPPLGMLFWHYKGV